MMTVTDLIAVFLSFLALLYLSVRRSREERKRREHPERYQAEQEEEKKAMKELLESLDLPIPEELEMDEVAREKQQTRKEPPAPPKRKPAPSVTSRRTVRQDFRFQSALDRFKKRKNPIAHRHLKSTIGKSTQRKYSGGVAKNEIGAVAEVDAYEITDVLGKDAYEITGIAEKDAYKITGIAESDAYKIVGVAEKDAYVIASGARSSRVQRLLRSRHSKRDMIVLREVLGPALGLRKPGASLPLPWKG